MKYDLIARWENKEGDQEDILESFVSLADALRLHDELSRESARITTAEMKFEVIEK